MRRLSTVFLIALAHLALIGAASAQSVAVLGSPANATWNADVQAKIAATGKFNTVDAILLNVGNDTPTLAELQAYDAVLVYSDSPFADSIALGNVLADYADAGGGVVVATFGFNNNGLALLGRMSSAGYVPLTRAAAVAGAQLGFTAIDSNHPIMQGVAAFNGGTASFHHSGATPTPGALVVANWSNGQPLVVVHEPSRSRVVGLNFFPPSSAMRADFWVETTNGGELMANALAFAAEPCANFDRDANCDTSDVDDDNDGVNDDDDPAVTNPAVCGDADADGCDDCAIGTDGLGPDSDADVNNDGEDGDGDGLCDIGDPDLDGDDVLDVVDNCPQDANADQRDVDGDGIGDVCDDNSGAVGCATGGTGGWGALWLLLAAAVLVRRRRRRRR